MLGWLNARRGGAASLSLAASVLVGCVATAAPRPAADATPSAAAPASLPPVPVAAPPVSAAPLAEASAPATARSNAFRAGDIRSDPPPRSLIHSSHYWISNEHSHFVWHAPLQALGGAYLGVGTDQNYLLAGWARPELLLLVDFDASIVDLHRAYRVAFTAAASPAEFLALWSPAGAAAHAAHIVAAYPDPDLQARVLAAQRTARRLVHHRLRTTLRVHGDRGIATYLDDAAQYEHLRRLWQEDRVLPIRGDLTGDAALVDIAAALRAAGLTLSVLYLSNAEQYFDFVPSFRRNVLALPMDERSVVLRTLGWRTHGFVAGEYYHYNRQSGANFREWLRLSRVARAGGMLAFKRPTAVHGVSVLDALPVPARRPPTIAASVPTPTALPGVAR